jgi:hypothetical protein
MVRPLVVLALFSAIVSPSVAQTNSSFEPTLTGYVTRVTSPSDFDVNGLNVVITPKTEILQSKGTSVYAPRTKGGKAYIGERAAVFGTIDRKHHLAHATEIFFLLEDPATLSGIALVDRILPSASKNETLLLADGYRIRIDAAAKTAFAAPLTSPADIQPGTWIAYHGTLDINGILVADQAAFEPNDVAPDESKLVNTTNYDPSAVPDNAKQNIFLHYGLGMVDPKKIPPYHDDAMQSRITRIGNSLIPEFQRKLPDSDPRKIHFQFQLVKEPKWRDAWALPSGIILVPHHIVERLTEDPELAAVLADNIAEVIEKQAYRIKPTATTLAVINWTSFVGGLFFAPGLVLAEATSITSHNIQTNLINQSGRVSLGYLHDAGYDERQAPIAWWRLASKSKKPLAETTIPPRSANLFRTIGLVWSTEIDASPKPNLTPADGAVSTK